VNKNRNSLTKYGNSGPLKEQRHHLAFDAMGRQLLYMKSTHAQLKETGLISLSTVFLYVTTVTNGRVKTLTANKWNLAVKLARDSKLYRTGKDVT